MYNQVIKKGIATQEAYEKIKRLISINEFVPGQKLIYDDMAKKLNMGVTPIIQALNRLESSNLVKYVPNKGYFVGEITETDVRQLYQAREALEVSVIPDVIKNINSKKLNEIRLFFEKRKNVKQPRRELILDDTLFHLSIVECANNNVIYNLLKYIFEQVYLKYRPEYLSDARLKVCLGEHKVLLDTLAKGNVEETIVLVREHIRSGMEYIIGSIQLENP
ncbi:MAG TPA: GntR family transcriptional regulator [Deltaproteobacteria bacterium]|nr:GntR family transcriptional regulator [Deltaproteobacteria bacterium]